MAFCRDCGCELKGNENFCSNCGKKVETAQSTGKAIGVSSAKRKEGIRKEKIKKKKSKGLFNTVIVVLALLVLSLWIIDSLQNTPTPTTTPILNQPNFEMKGTVTKIVDGDTLYIDSVKVRLSLVDTPEIGEQGYEEAAQFTANICLVGTMAYLDIDDGQPTDRYGRTIAVVYCKWQELE